MKYRCNNCGYTTNKMFYLCPKCQDGEGEEFEDKPSKIASGSKILSVDNSSKEKVLDKIVSVKSFPKNEENFKVVKTTKFKGFNELLSSKGGFVSSQVILIGADAGTGKTTLMTQISEEDTLFISTEETFSQVKNRFERVNKDSEAKILSTTSYEDILISVENCIQDLIIIDSINSIENGSLSYVRIAQIVQELTSIAKRNNKCLILISQVGRSGEILGMNSSIHAVDTVINMSRSPVSENITCVSTKNRFGSVGDIFLVRHRENGLEEVEQESMDFAIGTTCFYMQAGTKRLPFSVQALICVAQDARPTRRGIGITNNQIMLWNAILGCNDKGYGTSECDIYMSTSNGVSLAPGNDLAGITAMLSAYYQKIVEFTPDQLHGMVSLNGSISGNMYYKHIKDVIKLYK